MYSLSILSFICICYNLRLVEIDTKDANKGVKSAAGYICVVIGKVAEFAVAGRLAL